MSFAAKREAAYAELEAQEGELDGFDDEPASEGPWIVIYRPHNVLNCDTRYIGPFADYLAAEDALCALGALGPHIPEGVTPNPGVKFIQPLERPAVPAQRLAMPAPGGGFQVFTMGEGDTEPQSVGTLDPGELHGFLGQALGEQPASPTVRVFRTDNDGFSDRWKLSGRWERWGYEVAELSLVGQGYRSEQEAREGAARAILTAQSQTVKG
jgi:hypothetical protein